MMAAAQQQQLVQYPAQQAVEVLDRIGKGSYGVVHKAKYRGHICAVKVLLPELVQHRACQRFNQECDLMNKIRHDNIVQCFEVMHLEQPVLIMELMDKNLRQYLEDAPIRYYTQVDIVTDIVKAIAYLHGLGVIHRDLSSANVLMKKDIAKITDFGMARLLSTFNSVDLTRSPGTALYMPPEARLSPPEYDHRVDIFSIGVLIIQILTRKLPAPVNVIKAPQPRHCISEIERRANHIMASPDNDLRNIAVLCLSDRKEDRPSANQLCDMLFKVKESVDYSEDKCIGEQGMQLAVQHNIPAVVQSQCQTIEQQSQVLTSLQAQVAELQQIGCVQMEQIQQLQSQVASDRQLQQKMQEDHQNQLAKITEEVRDLLVDRDQQFEKRLEENNQQFSNFIQKMRSESDEEKQRLQQEKQQLQQEKQESEHKLLQLEQSFSSLSVASSSFLQDSRSDSRLSFNEMAFKSVNSASQVMHRWSSAVVHNNILYLIPGRTKKILKFDVNNLWAPYCDCEAENSTLAIVGDDLVAIGGQFYSGEDKGTNIKYTADLCTFRDGKWIRELPSMAVERDSVIAATNGNALIVAGGRGISPSKKPGFPLKIVEILHVESQQWQQACSLPSPLYHASVTIHSDKLFILGGFETARSENCSVFMCKLTNLILSRDHQSSCVWSEVSKLPVSKSTCVAYNHQLLAIGGLGADHTPSDAVYCYDEEADSWRHFASLETARIQCFSAVLSSQLFVIGGRAAAAGGGSLLSSVEVTV